MIYKAGHKYIDLERVTAIEPIVHRYSSYFCMGEEMKTVPPPEPYIIGVKMDCQLHEKPIELHFPWNGLQGAETTPSQQFDDLMQAWRAVVEKRNPPPTPPHIRAVALGACPACQTFHTSNEVCPGPASHQI